MKKTVSIILIVIFLFVSAVANAATDFASMTDEQLKEQFSAIRNELVARGLKAENKTVIVDKDGYQIYINGDITVRKMFDWGTDLYLYIPVVVVNSTSQNLNMMVENSSVNGWSVDGNKDWSSVPAGKKAKGNLYFSLEDAEMETLEDFSDVEFSLRVYDDNSWKDLFITKPITIYADK